MYTFHHSGVVFQIKTAIAKMIVSKTVIYNHQQNYLINNAITL